MLYRVSLFTSIIFLEVAFFCLVMLAHHVNEILTLEFFKWRGSLDCICGSCIEHYKVSVSCLLHLCFCK
jgi:hypothetical protein